MRLNEYDYSSNGAYFTTICVKNRLKLLGTVVGYDNLGAPYVRLSEYGNIVQKNINLIELYYKNVSVDKYVIMPNHVHMIITVSNSANILPRPHAHFAIFKTMMAAA